MKANGMKCESVAPTQWWRTAQRKHAGLHSFIAFNTSTDSYTQVQRVLHDPVLMRSLFCIQPVQYMRSLRAHLLDDAVVITLLNAVTDGMHGAGMTKNSQIVFQQGQPSIGKPQTTVVLLGSATVIF